MRTQEISMVAYWKKLVMKFSGGDIHQGEHGINKDLHTLLTHSSSVNYDIQTDDQQYGLKIFCQASGGACYQ